VKDSRISTARSSEPSRFTSTSHLTSREVYSELGRPDHSKTLSYNSIGFMLDPSSCTGDGRARGSTSISAVTAIRAANEQPIRALPCQCPRVFRSTMPTTAATPGMFIDRGTNWGTYGFVNRASRAAWHQGAARGEELRRDTWHR
jgi:hypothetical protein